MDVKQERMKKLGRLTRAIDVRKKRLLGRRFGGKSSNRKSNASLPVDLDMVILSPLPIVQYR